MEFFQIMAWLYWDPSRQAFTIPYLNHPVAWYGLLFVSGFICGYFVIHPIFMRFLKEVNEPKASSSQKIFSDRSQMAYFLTDRLCWFVIAGTIIGARLGDVLFYSGPYWENPIEIFKIWHGGLASHGGVTGVLIALYFYLKYVHQWIPQLTYLRLLDFVAIPSALVACFIRLGNFVNQEILGKATQLPWGIVFGHPADGSFPVARHPVQLYEAGAYLMTFIILGLLWRKQKVDAVPGTLIGWMFILIFGSRFVIEFFKASQDSFLNSAYLEAGQLLSLPFIFLGSYLVIQASSKKTASLSL
jgi:phosphatidylglycerol---prolipoprotein diacylglyceryl transferase